MLKKLRPEALPERDVKRHAWVCLLLAFLFLYNPYLIAQGSGDELSLRHPASHRATVGSSELEKYSSPSSHGTHLVVLLFFAKVISLLPNITSQSFLVQSSEHFPSQQFLCASLWFRPPPAL